jgi:hypothetical protein
MDAKTKAFVRRRAGDCCEYCRLRQADSPLLSLQIEHVVARKHHGSDSPDNLALACVECNLHKGSDLSGIDPETRQLTRLFNPRVDVWDEHFVWHGVRIEGLTAIGRTTVDVLDMNGSERLEVRSATQSGQVF